MDEKKEKRLKKLERHHKVYKKWYYENISKIKPLTAVENPPPPVDDTDPNGTPGGHSGG